MKVLILGGTSDARKMAEQLHTTGIALVYSLVGMVRTQAVAYPVVNGGFSQFGGLANYIRQQKISSVIDATHPYALKMTMTAQQVTKDLALPYWRFQRPAWQPSEHQHWRYFDTMAELFAQLKGYQRIFLSAGQINEKLLLQLSNTEQILLRTAVKPSFILPTNITWIKAIGPFSEHDERALFRRYQPQVLVTKNSGGDATIAKLIVAHQMEIPVYMLNRPDVLLLANSYTSITDLLNAYQRANR